MQSILWTLHTEYNQRYCSFEQTYLWSYTIEIGRTLRKLSASILLFAHSARLESTRQIKNRPLENRRQTIEKEFADACAMQNKAPTRDKRKQNKKKNPKIKQPKRVPSILQSFDAEMYAAIQIREIFLFNWRSHT